MNTPKTYREMYRLLDKMLTPEEQKQVMESTPDDLHFGLGLFIRNEWIYTQPGFLADEQLFDERKPILYVPDDISDIAVRHYRKHLLDQERYRRKKQQQADSVKDISL